MVVTIASYRKLNPDLKSKKDSDIEHILREGLKLRKKNVVKNKGKRPAGDGTNSEAGPASPTKKKKVEFDSLTLSLENELTDEAAILCLRDFVIGSD